MKHLYTAYLGYPPETATLLQSAYNSITEHWPNKRTFEFLPMIPLWKVIITDSYETDLVRAISTVTLSGVREITIKGYEARVESGYIFVVFNKNSSNNLRVLSEQLSGLMSIGDYEAHKPYGFEPHTSLIKQDSSEVNTILKILPTDIAGSTFTPPQLIVSKEIKGQHGVSFQKVLELPF